MKCLDSSLLSDYLRSESAGHEQAAEVIEGYDGTWYTPTPVLWEMLRYAAQADRQDGVARTASALDWLEALPVTTATVQEAALIEAELLDQGTPINTVDLLIAGVVREAGGMIVTRDGDFKHVEGLAVEAYGQV